MRVKDCERCTYCTRRTWSHYHKCRDYHPIGMTHAYAFCTKHDRRVSEVKKCDEYKKQED